MEGESMGSLLATIAMLAALPGVVNAYTLINNGLDCSNPGNVIDTYLGEEQQVIVRNAGCGTPDPGGACPSPGDPTEVCVVDGAYLCETGPVYVSDSSTLTVTGGWCTDIDSWDSATVTVSGGEVLIVVSHGFSTVAVSGGDVMDPFAFDFSTLTVTGGRVPHTRLYDSSTLTVTGGSIGVVDTDDSSHATISGAGPGLVRAGGSSVITLVGGGFAVDGSSVPYGDLTAQTGGLTGTLSSGDSLDFSFFQGGAPCGYPLGTCTGTITLCPSLDGDYDGISDTVDGEFVAGLFVDQSTLWSGDFTDQHLGGTSFGYVAKRVDGLVVAVTEATNPDGFRVMAFGGPGNAQLKACGVTKPINLTNGDEIVITCSSLTVGVLVGPVEMELSEEAIVTVPSGATVTVTELTGEQFEIENSSPEGLPPVLIAIKDDVTELAPGESVVVFLSIPVLIDIKPGSDSNSINPFAQSIIPVAILGSDALDIGEVDLATLAFGPDGARPVHNEGGHLADVNEDGFADLLSHYSTRYTGIAMGDTDACVTGELLSGVPFEGCDTIRTETSGHRRCGGGAWVLFVVGALLGLTRGRRRFST
jgi:hypothetical protein